MSKVVRTDSDNLNAVLTITFSPDDYESKFKAELSKYRKKTHMKGFRKGKTPMGFIKKMYGRAILAEVINESLQKEMTNYLQDEKLDILGQPLPSEDQAEYDFNINDLQDFVFKFDIGLAPQFEVQGIDKDTSYDMMEVEVTDEMITKNLDEGRLRVGKRESVDTDVQPKDVVAFNAEELDGEESKEKGWATTFSVLAETIAEKYRDQILGLNKGDQIRFNIFELEENREEDYVRKYLLNVGENDEEVEIGTDFIGTISDITRVVSADMDEEFFDKYFGEGVVKTEEEAKAKVEEMIAKQYERQAESLLFRDFQEGIIEKNPLELPDAFLKRWVKYSNEEATDEQIEKEYDAFANNLKWSLIRGKAVQKFDINVTSDQIFEAFKERIRSYFGGYGDELIVLNTANRLMEDKNQVDQMYQELISDKLFDAVKENISISKKKVSVETLEEEIKKAREAAMPKGEATDESTNEEPTQEEVTEDVEQ